MIANMDTTGTFSIAAAASKHKIITCIHKHYTPNEWGAFAEANEGTLEYVAASAGSSGEFQRKYSWFNTIDFGLKPPPPPPPLLSPPACDFDKLQAILTAHPQIPFICLDVANGYSEFFIACVRKGETLDDRQT